MTDQRVKRLLWRGEARWLIAILLGFILIGATIGFIATQKFIQSIAVSMPNEQFFWKYMQAPNDVLVRTEGFSSHYFYFLAIFTGLISVFWGRRTHYFEFLFNIGATRKQIFKTQIQFSTFVTVIGALGAELAEYAVIKWLIPARHLTRFPYQIIIGQAFSAAGVALLLFGLGLLIACLSDNFIFAVILSLLIWRPFFSYLTDGMGDQIKAGRLELWVQLWLHHYLSMIIALIVAVILILAARWFFLHWSAENSRRIILFHNSLLLYQLLLALGFGTILGEFFLGMFFRTGLMVDLSGIVLFFILSLIWQYYQNRKKRGGQQNVDY